MRALPLYVRCLPALSLPAMIPEPEEHSSQGSQSRRLKVGQPNRKDNSPARPPFRPPSAFPQQRASSLFFSLPLRQPQFRICASCLPPKSLSLPRPPLRYPLFLCVDFANDTTNTTRDIFFFPSLDKLPESTKMATEVCHARPTGAACFSPLSSLSPSPHPPLCAQVAVDRSPGDARLAQAVSPAESGVVRAGCSWHTATHPAT